MTSKCARPSCLTPAKSSCSVCEREHYCSSSCQKLDWKAHRSMCPILKKLSNKLQPFDEVVTIVDEVLLSKKGDKVRILEHLLSYTESQFGKEMTRIGYRERGDGTRISNWVVDIFIFYNINFRLAELYRQNNSISSISRNNRRFPYLERSLSLLNPFLIHVDSDGSNGIDSLNEGQVNQLLDALFTTEQDMAVVTTSRRHFDIAEGHCQRCLAYSRRLRVEGEQKTTSIFRALQTYCTLRNRQGNFSDALTFAEECYNLVVEAYDPVHTQVQQAAGMLIDILITKGDLYNAERYAEITYSNLRDKKNGVDQEGEEVAVGAYNLASVIHQQMGDLIKAEKLAREALRIRTLRFGSDHNNVGVTCDLLARILATQCKLGDDTRGLLERSLAISIRNTGKDGLNTAVGNSNIGQFYHELAVLQSTADSRPTHLLLAKTHLEEAHRIYSKVYGPSHPDTLYIVSRLAAVSST